MLGLDKALENNRGKTGYIFEFGVASGITFCQILKKIGLNITLIGFDSFQGLPKEKEGIWAHPEHGEGQHCRTLSEFNDRMINEGHIDKKNWGLVSGFYEESLKSEQAKFLLEQAKQNLIFVNLDVDLYISSMQVLEYIQPALRIGTIIYFDDWKDPNHNGPEEGWGEHKAWQDFSAKNPTINGKWTLGENNCRCLEITEL